MAHTVTRLTRFNMTSLALGLAFLHLPIVILVIYSFNASRLVTVWGGWSLRWYQEFFNDRAMLEAAWMSRDASSQSAKEGVSTTVLARSSRLGKHFHPKVKAGVGAVVRWSMFRSTTLSLSSKMSRSYCVSDRARSFANEPRAHFEAHSGTIVGGTAPPTNWTPNSAVRRASTAG